MFKKRRYVLTTTQIIMLSFAAVILIGSFLLSLPIATTTREAVSYADAIFTATTATCVTGLVTLPTATTWSVFGQVVILLLIQIGGLGVITVMGSLMLIVHRKMGLKDSQLISDAFNLDTLAGLSVFIKKVVIGTFIIEGAGALLYMTVFVPAFGVRGIWISVFNSVSAFCNAGIDIIGTNSLCDYGTNFTVNLVTALLIVLGGLGYIVWWDLIRVLREWRVRRLRSFQSLTLHSKIVLWATAVLLVGGAVLILVLEWNNPLTLGGHSLWDKLQLAFFQSVTTRTAGFATIAQENLTDASAIVCLLLMFIGGSPVGTAGGIKTVTFVVLLATASSVIVGKNETVLFDRTVSKKISEKAIAVCLVSFFTVLVSTVLLCAVSDASALDILYETVSATATVGLTRNLTPFLNLGGKLILTATMFLGRVGPISLVIAFRVRKEKTNHIKNPTEDVTVG